jgi:hypothetical protein
LIDFLGGADFVLRVENSLQFHLGVLARLYAGQVGFFLFQQRD